MRYHVQRGNEKSKGQTYNNQFKDFDGEGQEGLFDVSVAGLFLTYDPDKPAQGQIISTAFWGAVEAGAGKLLDKGWKAFTFTKGSKYFVEVYEHGKRKVQEITKEQWGKIRVAVGGKETGLDIPMISNIPNAQLRANVDETMGYILNGGKIPKKIKQNWGREFENKLGDLPSVDMNGKPIIYKEYRVRQLPNTPKSDNVHRIVVGNDGKYYYTNTHYGAPDYQGIPFYEAGKLPKESTEKIFKKDNK